MRVTSTVVCALVQFGLLFPAVALSADAKKSGGSPADQLQSTGTKSSQPLDKPPPVRTPSGSGSGAANPAVSYETRGDGNRTMTVTLEAPTADATVRRDTNVVMVLLRSTSWFCERSDRTATVGQFSTRVRNMLNAHLAGTTPAPQSAIAMSSPQATIEAFGQNLFADDPRVLADGSAAYSSPNAGPAEIKRNDCYTRDEMQTIKSEVARIVRGPATN
jgi:hypothetical protein